MENLAPSNRRLLLLSFTLLTLLFSCKEFQGPEGEQGPQGEQGEKGDAGTANVLYSDWIQFNSSNWLKVSEFGRETQVYGISENLLTEEILDQGLVFVYIKFGGAPPPRPLPFTGYITSTTKDQNI